MNGLWLVWFSACGLFAGFGALFAIRSASTALVAALGANALILAVGIGLSGSWSCSPVVWLLAGLAVIGLQFQRIDKQAATAALTLLTVNCLQPQSAQLPLLHAIAEAIAGAGAMLIMLQILVADRSTVRSPIMLVASAVMCYSVIANPSVLSRRFSGVFLDHQNGVIVQTTLNAAPQWLWLVILVAAALAAGALVVAKQPKFSAIVAFGITIALAAVAALLLLTSPGTAGWQSPNGARWEPIARLVSMPMPMSSLLMVAFPGLAAAYLLIFARKTSKAPVGPQRTVAIGLVGCAAALTLVLPSSSTPVGLIAAMVLIGVSAVFDKSRVDDMLPMGLGLCLVILT